MRESVLDRTVVYVNVVFLTITAVMCLFPLYYVFIVSFTEPLEYLSKGIVLLPQQWSLISYEYLLSSGAFVRAIGVSAFLASAGTALSLLVTSGLAYALSRKHFLGRKWILLAVLITILFHPGIIPPYLVVKELGLINSIWSLIIPALTNGWYILLMKGFFDSIPEGLEEAATIDGCSDIAVWYKIVLPLSLPAMAAFGLFYAVAYWNTFFHAILYINDFKKWPLQVLLQQMLIDSSTSAGSEMAIELSAERQIPPDTLKMAAVVIGTLPILLVYPFLQKHFAKGAMVGSIKE